MSRLLFLAALAPLACAIAAEPAGAEWPTFRGLKRDNISPDKGLLKEWPEDGPKLLWKATGAGLGFSSVTVAAGKVFTMGTADGKSYIHAFSASKGGEALWSTALGKGGDESYKGTRCTPAYDGGLVYGLSALGDFACVTADKGEVKWKKSLTKDFGGSWGGWQYSESPLIDGDRVIITPGGSKALMVCLNKKTGEEIWRTDGGKAGDSSPSGSAGYASVVISNAGGVKQYVTLVGKGVIGVSAKDGKLLWYHPAFRDNTANIPSPIVIGDQILATAGYGQPAMLLNLTKGDDGFKVEEAWSKPSIGNRLGGAVVVGGLVFFDQDMSGNLHALKWKDGEKVWERDRPPAKSKRFNKGRNSAALAYADGMLYVRYQNGWMALVPAGGTAYEEKGGFQIPGVERESWSHPVVIGGRLYLREDDAIYCYDVKAK